MANLELGLELDNHQTRYRPGQVVSGRVNVRAGATVQCNGLKVALQWFTHGKGNRQQGDLDVEPLFIGQWPMGQVLSYPFRLDVPATPRPYAGELLNIGFRVHTTADIPWAFDPEAEQLIDIVHEAPRAIAISWNEAKHNAARSQGGCLFASIGLLVLALLIGVGAAVFAAEDALGLALVCLVFGLIGFFSSLSQYLADRRLGPVSISIEQRRDAGYRDVHRPDTLHVALSQARPDADTRGASATLDIREEVIRGSGTNKKTYTHPLYSRTIDLTPASPGRFEGDLELPLANVPASFYASDNKVVWEVQLDIDIPGAAHWKETVKLTARPAPGV